MRHIMLSNQKPFKQYLFILCISSWYFIFPTAHAVELEMTSKSILKAAISAKDSQLPNAYELIQRLDSQQREMARQAGLIEALQVQIASLNLIPSKQVSLNTDSNSNRDYDTPNNQMSAALTPKLEEFIQEQVRAFVKVELSAIDANSTPTQPYLIPPRPYEDFNNLESSTVLTHYDRAVNTFNTPENNASLTSTTQANGTKRQGELAYAAAYSALKREGVKAGILEMQAFIATYARHDLIPSAHYWLGEFYLKESPPNVMQAKDEFMTVITTYKNYPSNTKQSKALYRLAAFARSNDNVAQARRYIADLQNEYPESLEAKLAKSIDW